MKGTFTQDTWDTVCNCGVRIQLLRRGPVSIIPKGHQCPSREIQDAVLRTIRAEELCGLRVTPHEIAKRLRDFGVGDALILNDLEG